MPSLVKTAAAAVLAGVTALACTPAAAVETSGQGGAFADQLNQSFTAGNGLSSNYHIYAAGIKQGQAAGLILQFHGDGAYEFENPRSSYSLGGTDGIVAQARKRGYITVPVLAPDRSGSVTWWENGSANADYVADLINSLKRQYNIESEDIWLVGYSGGAQFITQFYLPKYASQVDGGGSVVFGGGGRPRVRANTFAPDLVKDFPMHWYTGASDSDDDFDALGAARAGADWYSDRGFETSLESPAGVDHNLSGRFGPVVARHLDDHKPNRGEAYAAPKDPPPGTPAGSRVWSKYVELGGGRLLGAPTSGEFCGLTNGGCGMRFERGLILWSLPTDAHFLRGGILERYAANQYEAGHLGYPTSDEQCSIRGGCFQTFTGGSIYWSSTTGAHFVRGAIRDHWAQQGWEAGHLGYPTSDEQCWISGGCFQTFTGGSIYWSPATGAQFVRGAIRDRWAAEGWEAGHLGYPTSVEICGLRAGECVQRFQGGSIYWSPSTGTRVVKGATQDR